MPKIEIADGPKMEGARSESMGRRSCAVLRTVRANRRSKLISLSYLDVRQNINSLLKTTAMASISNTVRDRQAVQDGNGGNSGAGAPSGQGGQVGQVAGSKGVVGGGHGDKVPAASEAGPVPKAVAGVKGKAKAGASAKPRGEAKTAGQPAKAKAAESGESKAGGTGKRGGKAKAGESVKQGGKTKAGEPVKKSVKSRKPVKDIDAELAVGKHEQEVRTDLGNHERASPHLSHRQRRPSGT